MIAVFPEWVKPGIDLFVISMNFDRTKIASARKVAVKTVSIKGTMLNGSMRAQDTTVRRIDDPEVLAYVEAQEADRLARAKASQPIKTEEFTLRGQTVKVALFESGRHEFSLDFMTVKIDAEGTNLELGTDVISVAEAGRFAILIETAHGVRLTR